MLGVLVAGEAAAVDELALEGRDPRFGHRDIEGVASRAHRRCDLELAFEVARARLERQNAAAAGRKNIPGDSDGGRQDRWFALQVSGIPPMRSAVTRDRLGSVEAVPALGRGG